MQHSCFANIYSFLQLPLIFILLSLKVSFPIMSNPTYPVAASSSIIDIEDYKIELTEEEEEYLKDKKYLTMVVDPNWQPYDFIKDGKHSGMGAEYMQLISKRLGIPIKLIPTKNWVESLSIAEKRQCDIITMLNKTPDRERYLDFTDPFFTSQIVIISKERIWLKKGLNELSGKKVAVGEGYWLEENIRRDYPDIDLVPLESPEDTLRMVAEGQAVATIVTLIEAMLIIRQEAFADLRIIGQTDYQNKLRLGVPKGESLLLEILQKSVHSFTEKEDNAIFAKWASISFEKPFNYGLLWRVSLLVVIILVVSLFWNRKLSSLNQTLKNMHVELESKNKALKTLSITDKLTGLFNRMKLDNALKYEIEQTLRYKKPLSLILMDIDYFKRINDTYGHQEGDKVLQHISQILINNVRTVDTVGRWGGEEFLFICPNTDLDGAEILAETLRVKIAHQTKNRTIPYTASFGVTQFSLGDNDEYLLYKADQALYKAKENGRNRVELCI